MKLLTTLVLMFCIGGVISKTVKKSTENVAAISKSDKATKDIKIELEPKKLKSTKLKPLPIKKVPPPAIIAIEIVDPNDNITKSKNSKRTIGSALGYGIPPSNSYGVTDKPKLVFYKYSQYDIPPHQGSSQSTPTQGFDSQGHNLQGNHVQGHNSGGHQQNLQNNDLQVQRTLRYYLGTSQHAEHSKPNVQNHEPTTLFTTFNQHGHVGGFTQNVPRSAYDAPVILLRIYTNQLGGALYPNLPVTHPYAGLNNVNLQNMLYKFFDKHFYQQQNRQQHQVPQQSNYQQTQYQPHVNQYYTQPQIQAQDYYSNQPNQYHQQYQDDIQQYQYNQQSYDGLPTHENYPSDTHTRIVFHSNKSNGKNDIQQPRVFPSATNKHSQPQSYSSLELYNPKPVQSQDHEYGYPPQEYTLKQNQDAQGYYYYKPNIQQQVQNYKNQLQNYPSQLQDYQSQEQDYKIRQHGYLGLQQDYEPSQQNYQADEQDYKAIKQSAESVDDKEPIDTQKVESPHNYHAHPNTEKANYKRTVRKLEIGIRINTPKKAD